MSEIPDTMRIPAWEFRVVFGMTTVEYGVAKEQSNRKEHKYSLESVVKHLERLVMPWSRSAPFVTSDGFLENGEVRHNHLGVDDSGRVVFFVTTMRSEEHVRVISYRRASAEETKRFVELTGYSPSTL